MASADAGGQSASDLAKRLQNPVGDLVSMMGPWAARSSTTSGRSAERMGRLANSYNNFLTQPFVNDNFGKGWCVTSRPIVTANLEGLETKWTAPIGGGCSGSASCRSIWACPPNLVKPQYGADWRLRTQLTLIL